MRQVRLMTAGVAWLVAAAALWAGGPSLGKRADVALALPYASLPAAHRDAVQGICEKPTLVAKSQGEDFQGKPEVYRFFLDRPDLAVTAWRRLGAKCVSINPAGNQQFRWTDENGGDVVWQTVLRTDSMRVWYAEGKVKPSAVMPLVPVKVVVVVRHGQRVTSEGTPMLHQNTEMYVHTDNKTAAAVAKMLGPTTQRVAEQGLGQFQFFFSGLCQYLHRNPNHLAVLIRDEQ